MDPLSVHMTMGSPPLLRGKISLSNLVGRNKKSPDSDRSSGLMTPKKLDKIDESGRLTPTRTNTVRKRRGFRPLSIITKSVFAPFEDDALKAMEELDRQESATDTSAKTRQQPPNESRLSNGSEVSLRAFLAQSSPPASDGECVQAPFPALYQIPAPDISQHPAYSSDPFTTKSDVPDLVTSSFADEIRKFAAQARSSTSRTDRTSGSSSDIFNSSNKKKFTFLDKLYSPASTLDKTSTNSPPSSPLARRQHKSLPIEVKYSTPDSPDADVEKKREASGRRRKFSDRIRSKFGSEHLDSPTTEVAHESPGAVLQKLEEHLRRLTCSPTYPYTETSWLPRHPNTGRFWRSRNLKCTNCIDTYCACCKRTCCAYRAAVLALETHKDNPIGREDAREKIHQITMVFPYGREMPTFLQCTHGFKGEAGCGKLVCPDCCGVCPDDACGDIQCRRCKKDPWAECDWHKELDQAVGIGDATSTIHAV